MATIARVVGGAGTGTTTELMRIMGNVLGEGLDPMQIGFVSFTRAARREATERASELFGTPVVQLEQDGWYRTLHSVCFKCLGLRKSDVLGDDAEGNRWIEAAIDENLGKAAGREVVEESNFEVSTDSGTALLLWHAARNRLVGLREVHREAAALSDSVPSFETCRRVVTSYESAKRVDHRMDFTDILCAFAGVNYVDYRGWSEVSPEGTVPNLPVWFFDEQQDTSALLDRVCHRLIENAKWVYVVGDPFQSIYGWAGMDGSLFQKWEVDKQRVLPKTYRNPKAILDFAENILRSCTDYWDRDIKPADHDGAVSIEQMTPSLIDVVDPSESWLLIARTNYHANRLARRLSDAGKPYKPASRKGPLSNKRLKFCDSVFSLFKDMPIDSEELANLIDMMPAKFLLRGKKAQFKAGNIELDPKGLFKLPEIVNLELMPESTASLISAGDVAHVEESLGGYFTGRLRYGYDAIHDPKVRVGTIHSVKGQEADNVLWLTSANKTIHSAQQHERLRNEEHRVAYVAATRARKRLLMAVETKDRFRYQPQLPR